MNRGLRWLAIALIIASLAVHLAWPALERNWASQRAAELAAQYGIVVRYGEPAEFYVAPYSPVGPVLAIERVAADHVLTALGGVETALSIYPPELVRKHLAAVFVGGVLKLKGTRIGGTYVHAWIYVSAADDLASRGAHYLAETVHHEFSSLLFLGGQFPNERWTAVNEPDFAYLKDSEAVIEAAGKYRNPAEAEAWYRAGFVSDYGMSSVENDLNTFAELAFGRPPELVALARRHPKIAAKLRLFIEFYQDLAPELGDYFSQTSLAAAAVAQGEAADQRVEPGSGTD